MADSGPEAEGEVAGALGVGVGACPYPPGVKATAWRQGYRRAETLREIEEQEISGHFRDIG